jgi:hypothetical protein
LESFRIFRVNLVSLRGQSEHGALVDTVRRSLPFYLEKQTFLVSVGMPQRCRTLQLPKGMIAHLRACTYKQAQGACARASYASGFCGADERFR